MQYYIFDIGPKNVSSLTVLQSYIYRCYERICNITVLGPRRPRTYRKCDITFHWPIQEHLCSIWEHQSNVPLSN